jgi:general secretion pathway protein A
MIAKMDDKRTTTLAHWNLDRWPFGGTSQAKDFYPTSGREEAFARIEYLVTAGRRLGVLVGEAGAGKTTLFSESARRLRQAGCHVAIANASGVSPREFLWQVAVQLQTTPTTDSDVARLWRMIVDRIVENRLQGVSTVLLVDNAGEAGVDVLNQIVRLTRADATTAAKWTVLLSSETAQTQAWRTELRELIDLRIDVEAWEAEDTIGFVQHALLEAGCMSPLFNDTALRTLHELSGGRPRQICRIAEFALLAGAATGANEVDDDLLRSAVEELTWPTPLMTAR